MHEEHADSQSLEESVPEGPILEGPILEGPSPNAVGVLEYPEGYEASPRTYSRGLRWGALFFLALFFGVTVITSAISLGAYCLTSDGGDGRALWSSPLFDGDSKSRGD